MSQDQWYDEGFKRLRKRVRAQVKELRLAFCLEVESILTDPNYSHDDFDIAFKVKRGAYLRNIDKYLGWLHILDGQYKSGCDDDKEMAEWPY